MSSAYPDRSGDPGEPAPLSRRLVGLVVDWGIAMLISSAFLRGGPWPTLGVFLLEQWLLVGTAGATIGHRIVGLGVQRLHGGPAGPGRAAVRAGLLCLVIPAVVWDSRGRGLHDVVAGTAVVRCRDGGETRTAVRSRRRPSLPDGSE